MDHKFTGTPEVIREQVNAASLVDASKLFVLSHIEDGKESLDVFVTAHDAKDGVDVCAGVTVTVHKAIDA